MGQQGDPGLAGYKVSTGSIIYFHFYYFRFSLAFFFLFFLQVTTKVMQNKSFTFYTKTYFYWSCWWLLCFLCHNCILPHAGKSTAMKQVQKKLLVAMVTIYVNPALIAAIRRRLLCSPIWSWPHSCWNFFFFQTEVVFRRFSWEVRPKNNRKIRLLAQSKPALASHYPPVYMLPH